MKTTRFTTIEQARALMEAQIAKAYREFEQRVELIRNQPPPKTQNVRDMKVRWALAAAKRAEGWSLKQIGELLGVRRDRAAELVRKGERLGRTRSEIEDADLSTYCLNILLHLGISTIAELRARRDEVVAAHGVGKKMMLAIDEFLAEERQKNEVR